MGLTRQTILFFALLTGSSPVVAEDLAKDLLDASGVQGGLAVHLGVRRWQADCWALYQ